ncbi:putative periplasmic protein kinase ArgK and related GTPases of G3E family [hydrothermal vent metagenome]|uniref:Putative periplasmic protein kinase ArgK and related GTPases of G3E family n=1 Tax=hydrothermal vent metagenome TaxID=652676 RepID=A0A3B0SU35_9ZZZZ
MPIPIDSAVLLAAARRGDRRSLARLITGVEGSGENSRTIMSTVYADTGRAWTTGMTGSPGAGKSTLTNHLIRHARATGNTVGVVAVDPSSPFTGGAILGDRVRMQDHIEDPGVYIRSMASRGQLGGLAAATSRVVMVLDALGFDDVLVETVGVGQAEVDIASNVDTTVVVVNPRWGDAVQTAKAGLLEIGDVFVVNKADRPGVDETVRDLNAMVDLGESQPWRPPIVTCVALTGDGTSDVWDAVAAHRTFLDRGAKNEERRMRRRSEFYRALMSRYTERATHLIASTAGQTKGDAVANLELDPWTAADELAWEVIR